RPDGEQRAVGLELPHPAVLDEPDVDGNVVEIAEREELQLVFEALSAPDRLLRTEADVAILVVGELGKRLRQLDLRPGEGTARELRGSSLDDIGGERGCAALGFADVLRRGPVDLRSA